MTKELQLVAYPGTFDLRKPNMSGNTKWFMLVPVSFAKFGRGERIFGRQRNGTNRQQLHSRERIGSGKQSMAHNTI